jgi:uncharacterized membrane protein
MVFWLSLVPFVTGWMGENHFTNASLFLYGIVLLGSAIAYVVLQNLIIKSHGDNSILKESFTQRFKGQNITCFIFIGNFVFFF